MDTNHHYLDSGGTNIDMDVTTKGYTTQLVSDLVCIRFSCYYCPGNSRVHEVRTIVNIKVVMEVYLCTVRDITIPFNNESGMPATLVRIAHYQGHDHAGIKVTSTWSLGIISTYRFRSHVIINTNSWLENLFVLKLHFIPTHLKAALSVPVPNTFLTSIRILAMPIIRIFLFVYISIGR